MRRVSPALRGYPIIDFLPMDGDRLRGIEAEGYLMPFQAAKRWMNKPESSPSPT
jgi:hypothetical protein